MFASDIFLIQVLSFSRRFVPMDPSVKREIRKVCWQGVVPVCFRLSAKDAAGSEMPLPLYVMLPRLSYFPLVFDRVKAYFLGVVPTAMDEIWLESSAGVPLRWHLAVGVLFDLHSDSLMPPIPWQVTVHFSSFPEDRLIRLTGVEALKNLFMSALKEANFLKYGDGGKVMSLSRSDQDSLWLSIGQMESGLQQLSVFIIIIIIDLYF
jgi:autophagy-related protein 5